MTSKSKSTIKVLVVISLLVILSSCSAPAIEEDKLEEPEQPGIEEPEPSLEPTPEPEPTVKIIPLEDLEEWDLVWISDSSGWGVADLFGQMVAEDTGKTVNVNDLWTGALPAGTVLQALNGTYQGSDYKIGKYPDYLAQAEIVVFYANPMESVYESNPGDNSCEPPGPWYVNQCDPENYLTYIEHLREIYRLILELRGGQPTIIRTYDAYNPLINQFRESGVYEDCKACWGYYNDAMRQAAAEMQIPLAPVAELWNGPDWSLDPEDDLGYTSDSIHPNELGAEVIAQALRELGYEPVNP